RWLSAGWSSPVEAPRTPNWLGAPTITRTGRPTRPDIDVVLPPFTETGAWNQWEEFRDRGIEGLDGYDDRRNDPSVAGTSRMSTALRWGLVHPRQLLLELDDSKAHQVFRSEIAWREFYGDVLFHRPDTTWQNLNRKMDAIVHDEGPVAVERFRAWCEGRTGYPIVDAGMRELLATGWMHNRVRMIVASFLVKDLHLPWQWGARHFMRHLADGDVASNSHGWQWTAGTGTDAAPYFRVFNPVAQGERWDPTGDYVRRFVPELADLATSQIHAPWSKGGGVPLGYVPPIVDHAVEREEALARYKAVTGG
ncbi:MAG: cryptochrome/photolyase family protein, partial [Ilumatobacteraceae bacterium]